MKQLMFEGSAPALITPMKNGSIDYDALGRLIDMQAENGSSAIVIAGTTGESAVLSYEEHEELVHFAVRYADGRIPILAGAGSNSTDHALRLMKQAENGGADGLLLVTPYYNKTSQSGLLAHYAYLADRSTLPILLYHVPSRTGLTMSPETVAELSRHPQIVGIKEAGSDLDAIAKEMLLCEPDFAFYSGNDSLTLPLMAMGAKGVISVAANLIPRPMSELCRLALLEEYTAARRLHFAYLTLMQVLFCEVNPIPVKTAMSLCGLCDAELRLPLVPPAAGNLARIKAVLADYGLLR